MIQVGKNRSNERYRSEAGGFKLLVLDKAYGWILVKASTLLVILASLVVGLAWYFSVPDLGSASTQILPPDGTQTTTGSPANEQAATFEGFALLAGEGGSVTNFVLHNSSDVDIRYDSKVVGFEYAGQARAYLTSSMSELPERHVVSDLIGPDAVTVTYCDLADTVRIFVSKSAEAPLELSVVGLAETPDGERMVLEANGTRFFQDSAKAPYDKLSFVVTTWGEWVQLHPATLVYVGPSSDTQGNAPPNREASTLPTSG